MPFPSPGDLPDPGIEPGILHWPTDSLPLSQIRLPGKVDPRKEMKITWKCCFCCSIIKLYPTLWDLIDCSIPGFPVLHLKVRINASMKDNFHQHLICLNGDWIFKEKIIAMCYGVHKICRSELDDIIAQKKEEGINLSVLVKAYT